jgi:hypothetical protein
MPSADDPSADRLKVWLDFWKFVVVSGVLALVGTITPPLINYQIQQKELAIKEKEQNTNLAMAKSKADTEIRQATLTQETKYVDTFFERATTENIETRYRFTQYFSALTRDPDYKKGWETLLDAVQQERKSTQERLEKARADVPTKSGEERENALAEITRLMLELSVEGRELRTREPPTIVPLSVNYSTIVARAPCPSGTTEVISATRDLDNTLSPFPYERSVTDPLGDAAVRAIAAELSSVHGDSVAQGVVPSESLTQGPNVTRLLITKHCVDKEYKVVGPSVFASTGGRLVVRQQGRGTEAR